MDKIVILQLGTTDWRLTLTRAANSDAIPGFATDTVSIESSDGTRTAIEATLPYKIVIPAWAIDGNKLSPAKVQQKLAAATAIARMELQAELLDALRRLETVEVTWSGAGFLNLPGAAASGRGEAKLLLSKWLMGAAADVHQRVAEFSVRVTASRGAGVFATCAVACVVRLDQAPALRLDLDDFNVAMPEFPFPDLDLANPVSLDWPAGSAFSRLYDRFAGGAVSVSVAPDPAAQQPRLYLQPGPGGKLQWALANAAPSAADWASAAALAPKLSTFTVTVKGAGGAEATVSQVKAARLGSEFILEGVVGGSVVVLNSVEWKTRFGALEIIAGGLKVTASASGAAGETALVGIVEFERLTLRLADDPEACLVLKGAIEMTPSATRILRLELLQPYPIALVTAAAGALQRGANAVAAFVGNIGAVDAGRMRELLTILGKFAAAMARTVVLVGNAVANAAQQAAQLAARTLAGIADALAALLQQLQALVPAAPSGWDFEVRVALDPLELRQILITRQTEVGAGPGDALELKAAGLVLNVASGWKPGLLLDFVDQPGAYLIASRVAADAGVALSFATLGTDLWLASGDTVSNVRDAAGDTGKRAESKRLISLDAMFKPAAAAPGIVLVLAGLTRAKPVFLQRVTSSLTPGPNGVAFMNGPFTMASLESQLDVAVQFDAKRVLPLLGMGETGSDSGGAQGGFLDKLKESLGQVVWVERTDTPVFRPQHGATPAEVSAGLVIGIKAAGVSTTATLKLTLDLATMEARLTGGDKFDLKSRRIEEKALGLTWIVEQKDKTARANDAEVAMFKLSFADGESSFALDSNVARMELRFNGLSSDGEGVAFDVTEFSVGRRGVDIKAAVSQNAVRLNGLDVPFQFTAGKLVISASRLVEGSITGHGSLPPALVGEAECTLGLAFTQDDSGIVLQSGKVEIDKKDEPIVCHSTRFTLTINDLDVGIAKDGGYHFYFLVTGSLRFTPNEGEFDSGLLGFLKDIEINLERTPLTGDASVLMKHVSFQKVLNPKKSFPLFNLFEFELRGFGFHPSSPRFGGSPAINLSGQIKFAEIGDVMQPKIDFHSLWIAPPAGDDPLPRISAEGLGLELQLPGSVKVRGCVLAVDPDTRTVEGRQFAPPGYNTYGFLGEGEVDIPGWGSMQASLGFLEIERKDQPGERRKAFFLYLQKDKLAVKIPTPFWVFYMREAGFGFGYRYTLAGIKATDTAKTPAQLITVLDDVSRRQGDLARFSAWSPDPEGDRFTLALRAALQAYPAAEVYDDVREEMAENPFFFDLMLAVRSDLTILATMRGYLGVNYADFRKNTGNLRENPGLRGYLYISAPRSELLARMVGDPKGFIGERFPGLCTGEVLRSAVQSVDWSSTLYIRPGLFHYELGWPDQLAVRLVDTDTMKVSLRGGMIFRASDDGLLWGYNIAAEAWLRFGGSVGDSIGVALDATLQARLVARLLAFLSWRFQGSLVYGLITLDASLAFSVRAWMEVDLGFTSFTIRISFSFSVQFSAVVELAVTTEGVGGRVAARVAISVFGCTLGVGVGFSFQDGLLDEARNRVQRFMALSITSEQPDSPPVLAARTGDERIDTAAKQVETARKGDDADHQPHTSGGGNGLKPSKTYPNFNRPVPATAFWMVLHEAAFAPDGAVAPEGYAYAMLVPREATGPDDGGFYSAPVAAGAPSPWLRKPEAHEISFGAAPPATVQIAGAARSWPTVAAATMKCPVDWEAGIPVDTAGVTFRLAEMFDECFITDTKWSPVPPVGTPPAAQPPRRVAVLFQEPARRRYVKRAPAPQGASQVERDARRDKAQKGQASEAAGDSLADRVYQARSTLMSMFVDQFVTMARNGPPRAGGEAHVIDLGLVLYGPVAVLEKISATMSVGKLDKGFAQPGKVALFNPSANWFRTQDPALDDGDQEVDASGVKLKWILSTPWTTRGEVANPADDAEQFLHHYEIVRTVEGRPARTGNFKVKPASTMGGLSEKGHHEVLPSDWQFTDSLDDLEAEERRALLPAIGETDAIEAAMAWARKWGGEEVTLTYSVTPIDIAGTRGLPKSFTVDIQRPQPPVRAAQAELRVVQALDGDESTLRRQANVGVPDDLEIYVALKDPAWKGDVVFDGVKVHRRYTLILDHEHILPAGHFGTDGMTDRIRGIGSAGAQASPHRFEFAFTNLLDVPNVPYDPKIAAPFSDIELDQNERERLPYWGVLVGAARDGVKPVLTGRERAAFLETLWHATAPASETAGARVACRMWLRTDIVFDETPAHVLSSTLTAVPVEISMRRTVPAVAASALPAIRISMLRPETFEWPVHLRFPPLVMGQVRVRTGFIHYRAPAKTTLLNDLVGEGEPLVILRDPQRRTMASIDFDAVPHWQDAFVAPAHTAAIAGFDVYEIDLDNLAPMDTAPCALESDARAWSRAQRVARVELLAQETASLMPAANSDWQGWQAHYPSETVRITGARENGQRGDNAQPILSGWYSARESTPHFPSRRPRLRLLPLPLESAITDLMARGRPACIMASFSAKENSAAARNLGPILPSIALFGPAVDGVAHDANALFGRSADSKCFRIANSAPMSAAAIRYFMLSLGWIVPNAAMEVWRENPAAFDGLSLQLEAFATMAAFDDPDQREKPLTVSIPLEFNSRVHPILEELFAELALSEQQAGEGIPAVYRRYAVMVQPQPPIDARDLNGFLAAGAPATDPYGWGVLQALGLAATLRLFDPALDAFERPLALANLVNKTLACVLKRWRMQFGQGDAYAVGQPFVELLLKPGADRVSRPFDAPVIDGAGRSAAIDLDDDGLAMLQVSLRPAPAAAWHYERLGLAWAGAIIKAAAPAPVPPRAPNGTDYTQTTTTSVTSARNVGLSLSIKSDAPAGVNNIAVMRASGGDLVWLKRDQAAKMFLGQPPSAADSEEFLRNGNPALELLLRGEMADVSQWVVLELAWTEEITTTVRTVVVAPDGTVTETQTLNVVPVLPPPPARPVSNDSTSCALIMTTWPEPDASGRTFGWQAIAEPGARYPDPFEVFAECSPEDWGRVFKKTPPAGYVRNAAAFAAFDSLRHTLRASAPELKFPEEDKYNTVVGAYLDWSKRLLEYCTGAALRNGDIALALAAPTKATPWRLAADARGRLRLGIPSDDRWAHARAYAVKPVSRYEHLMSGIGLLPREETETLVTPDMLAAGDPFTLRKETRIGYAVAATPRTERIEAPVIMGSAIKGNAWELVIPRHGEESLAASNRPLFARLGQPALLITQRRAYRTPAWPQRLRDRFTALPELPDTLPERIARLPVRPAWNDTQTTDPPGLATLRQDQLAEYAGQYPSLWKGADIFGILPVPPHYRVAALAVARAGIVVSTVSAIMQDDLPRAPLRKRDEVLGTGAGLQPVLSLLVSKDDRKVTQFCVRHRMVSHADLTPDFAQRWLRDENGNSNPRDVGWWPDPDVVYNIGHSWKTGQRSVEEEDAEVRLLPTPDTGGHPVMVRARGTRWIAAAGDGAVEMSSVGADPQFVLRTLFEPAAACPDSGIVTERLAPGELGSPAALAKFADAARRFAHVLVPHTVKFDFGRNTAEGEVEADYRERMRHFDEQVCKPLLARLAALGARFDVARLGADCKAVGPRISQWFENDTGAPGIDARFAAWLQAQDIAVFAQGVEIRRWPLGDPALPPMLVPAAAPFDDVVVSMWDVPCDEEVDALAASGLPYAADGARFWMKVGSRITGGAKLYLRAVDSRARLEESSAPGVVRVEVAWPDWIGEKTKGKVP